MTMIDLPAGSVAADDHVDAGTVPLSAVSGLAQADELALLERVRGFVTASEAPATVKAYGIDWEQFTAWCDVRGFESLPAEPATIAGYMAAMAGAGLAVATLGQAHVISVAHKAAGHDPSPTSARLGATRCAAYGGTGCCSA
jgi:hypothetical protein